MARIRSIKPEFWSHPVMSMASDETRLAAIGLLNFSDDEGYFLASPALVRSSLWPLDEDSTKARRVLADLSRIGWIEIRNHATHGQIGLVVNFVKHQRIDRPSPSKIKAYFLDESSTSPRRTLDDHSLLDQGSGIRDQGKDQGSKDCEFVADAPDEMFDELWDSYGRKKSKEKAVAHWKRMKQSDREAALAGVPAFVAANPDPGFRPDPVRYLRDKRWNDEPVASEQSFIMEDTPQRDMLQNQPAINPNHKPIVWRDEDGNPIDLVG